MKRVILFSWILLQTSCCFSKILVFTKVLAQMWFFTYPLVQWVVHAPLKLIGPFRFPDGSYRRLDLAAWAVWCSALMSGYKGKGPHSHTVLPLIFHKCSISLRKWPVTLLLSCRPSGNGHPQSSRDLQREYNKLKGNFCGNIELNAYPLKVFVERIKICDKMSIFWHCKTTADNHYYFPKKLLNYLEK